MSIISGFEEQKRYINLENGDKKAVSEWTSTDTVDVSPNITNYETDLAHSDEWNDTYDDVSSQPTGLTDLITKITAFFNNVKFLQKKSGKVSNRDASSSSSCNELYPILTRNEPYYDYTNDYNAALTTPSICINPYQNLLTLQAEDENNDLYWSNEMRSDYTKIKYSRNGQETMSLMLTCDDIILAGNETGNRWDGRFKSLKRALENKVSKPRVVQGAGVNINNFTTSGTYIMTGSNTYSNRPVSEPGQLEVTQWVEGTSLYFCRQLYKVYSTGNYADATFTRIGRSTNGTTWTWQNWRSDDYFIPGEAWTVPQGAIYSGHTTNAGTELFVSIPLPKRCHWVSGLSQHPMYANLNVRQAGQYLQGGDYRYVWKKWYVADNMLIVVYEKLDHTAFTNVINNDDCSIYVVTNFSITFQ